MKEFTFKAYLVSLALTEAVFAEKSGEEQGVLVAGYITEVSKKLEEAVENGASKEELETLRDEITKASSNSNVVMNTIKEHGVAIKELLNANAIAPSVSKTSIREQLEANKEAIASYAAGDERVKVSFKADMSIAGNAAGVPEPERISGVNDVATREITFVFPVRNRTPARFGIYPISSATCRTRSRVLFPMSLAPLRARDTVGTARPHILAMFFSVGRLFSNSSFSVLPLT